MRLGKFFVCKTGHALVMLDGTVTQHQMGEIQIPFMGRHIGALHHEAHVTEGACIHDFLEILAIEMLHILMIAFIDHIEKRGETVTKMEEKAAAMTNTETPQQPYPNRLLVHKKL